MDISADEVQVSWSSPADGVATTYTLPPNSTLDSSYLSTPCGSGETAASPQPPLCDLTNRSPRDCSSAWHPGGTSPRHSGRDTATSCASQPPSAKQPPARPQRYRCHNPWPKGWPAARLGASRGGWSWYEMNERMAHHEPPIALLIAPALPPTEESFLLMAGCKASYTVPKGGSVYVGVAVATSIRYSIFTNCVALSPPTQVLCGQATRATGRHTVGARLYLQPHGAHASHHRW